MRDEGPSVLSAQIPTLGTDVDEIAILPWFRLNLGPIYVGKEVGEGIGKRRGVHGGSKFQNGDLVRVNRTKCFFLYALLTTALTFLAGTLYCGRSHMLKGKRLNTFRRYRRVDLNRPT